MKWLGLLELSMDLRPTNPGASPPELSSWDPLDSGDIRRELT